MSVSGYRSSVERQARGALVTAIHGIPIFLAPGEDECEEDKVFIRWVHREHRVSSMIALRASTNAVDVRLERKLRFDKRNLKRTVSYGRKPYVMLL